jgi:capsid protein
MTYLEEVEQLTAVIDEIYETFVVSCVLAGLVNIRNFWNDKDTYLAHTWIRAPKAWIDPQKESSATRTALETGQKTFQQVAAESGRDWRQVIDDMAEAVDYADSKGLDLRGILYGTKEKETQPETASPDAESDDADTVGAGDPAEGSEAEE